MRFEPVATHDVTHAWDLVRPGIERIIRVCKEEFRPEDVYAALKANRAVLYIFRNGSVPVGFAVLEVIDGQKLNAWLLHLVNRTDDVREDLCAFLDDCAKRANCRVVRFMSPRQGWERFLQGEFKQKAVIYEREVK